MRFEQIVGNLLHNASKYTQRGGEVSVTVKEAVIADGAANQSAGKRKVAISIKDNGMGIAPDKLSAVFDMFMSATRSSDPEYGGLGLGLTLVARSGYGHEEARTKAREAGFDEYLVKPTRIEDLNRALARRG